MSCFLLTVHAVRSERACSQPDSVGYVLNPYVVAGTLSADSLQFAFAPLEMLSGRADDIYLHLKDKVAKNAASYPPGVLDFYKMQLERRERRAPGCEIISFPGFFSAPSRSLAGERTHLILIVFEDPPQPGKKYISIFMAMNHCLSRGNVVSESMGYMSVRSLSTM